MGRRQTSPAFHSSCFSSLSPASQPASHRPKPTGIQLIDQPGDVRQPFGEIQKYIRMAEKFKLTHKEQRKGLGHGCSVITGGCPTCWVFICNFLSATPGATGALECRGLRTSEMRGGADVTYRKTHKQAQKTVSRVGPHFRIWGQVNGLGQEGSREGGQGGDKKKFFNCQSFGTGATSPQAGVLIPAWEANVQLGV